MSACFITTLIELPDDPNSLNWDALDTWLTNATVEEMQEGYTECGFWDDEEATEENVRAIFRDLREEIEHEHESNAWRYKGLHLLITGGMSSGDEPTEAATTFRRAHAFPGALTAIGFPPQG